MSQNLVMRQMDERQISQEVSLLLWSPKMDILATAFDNGDLCLYRLQWNRVWVASANEDTVSHKDAATGPANERSGAGVSALCWRPDGKLLAAGYTTGLLSIRHIESKDSIHVENLDSKITWISWQNVPQSFVNRGDDLYSPLTENGWDLMTKLPSLDMIYSYNDSNDEELQDCRKLDDSGTPSILLVGTQTGSIYLLISGFLMCARLSVADLFGAPCEIVNAVVAADLKTFNCIMKQQDSYRLVSLESPIIATCQSELCVLATKFNIIQGTINYMEDTIKRIRESWENILLEMDTKLASYAKPNPPGTVAADLMELLLFGTFTPQLEIFLNELTDKGLKRMRESIELSYSNIQRLVIRYLHPVCQSLHFQLGELLGLARASHRYSVIGVDEEVVLNAIQASGLMWSKTVELQQVIDESRKNFKLFFRWLNTEILRKDGREIPEELKRMSQHDVFFIAEFIKRLDNSNADGDSPVYLEKVGQYLKDEDLKQPPDLTNNIWNQLLKELPELSSVPFILPSDSKSSTITQFNKLNSAVNKIFSGMNIDITNQTRAKLNLELCPINDELQPPASSSSENEGQTSDNIRLLSAQLVDDQPTNINNMYGERNSIKSLERCCQGGASWDRKRILYWELGEEDKFVATWLEPAHNTTIVDFNFYTKEILSILLETGDVQTLVQLPLPNLQSSLKPLMLQSSTVPQDMLNSNDIIEVGGRASCRDLENIRACSFSVSGTRNVSVMLFVSRKRLRIYDMEVEEEEDEEMFNSSGPLTETTDNNPMY